REMPKRIFPSQFQSREVPGNDLSRSPTEREAHREILLPPPTVGVVTRYHSCRYASFAMPYPAHFFFG
ncbi:MAG: hypothetical protein ACLFVQ_05560, partial [Chitinispirillaceae bacterium]